MFSEVMMLTMGFTVPILDAKGTKNVLSAVEKFSVGSKIRDLLMAKESLGPVAFDLEKKLILSCMEAGEKADLFSTKCEEYMVEEM